MLDELIVGAMFIAPGTQERLEPARPDPLVMADGTPVTSAVQWPPRRDEIAALFARHVYGELPPPPVGTEFVLTEEGPALDGAAWRRQITIRLHQDDQHADLHLLLFLPAHRSGPVPAFLGLNFYGNHSVTEDPAVPLCDRWLPERAPGVAEHRATESARGTAAERWSVARTVARGFAVATLYHGEVDPDTPELRDGARAFLERTHPGGDAERNGSTLGLWAWGLHRALDALVQDADVRPDQVVVMGHSRNGKAALLAGATDPRFAGVISNQSGCGGAALSRRRQGETVRQINERFPHWFCARFHDYNDREDALPVDQHLLIALIAPRPVLVCSAAEDAWADPVGEFQALCGADPVYRLLGVEGITEREPPPVHHRIGHRLQYHLRPGPHAVGPDDWTVFIDFAEQILDTP